MRLGIYLFVVSIFYTSLTFAQSIVLQGASGTFKDSGDYFTDVLGRAKNFDSPCDVIDDQHFFSYKVANNSVWTAQSIGKEAPIYSLLHIPTINTALTQKIECGPDAFQKEFQASDYQLLTYRIKLNSPTTFSALFWSRDQTPPVRGGFMGIGTPQSGSPPIVPNQWNLNWFFLPGNPALSESWNGVMKGLALAPAVPLPIGSVTELDWVRLVNTNKSDFLRLNWQSNTANIITPKVSIFLDNDASGYDGSPLFTRENPNSFKDIPLGMVAPGTYYIYVSLDSEIGINLNRVSYSNYIGPIVINAKPQIKVLSPSRFSGFEYSRDERKDPWDFNSLSDLSNVPFGSNNPPQNFRYFHDWSIQNNVFFAESDANNRNQIGDVQMHPTVNPNKPIRTNLYRYFCVRTQFDSARLPRDGNIAKISDAGWYARVMYQNSQDPSTFGSTKGFQIIETSTNFPDYNNGFNTYCIDLWDPQVHDSGRPFNAAGLVNGLRFDPHEAFQPTKFAVDSIGLYSENYTDANGIFKARWNISDKDSQNFNIKIYLDFDKQGYNGTLLKSVEQNFNGNGETDVDLSSLNEGYYYLYFEINDGINTLQYYADEPVKRTTSTILTTGPIKKSPCDRDGDGQSDFTLVRNFRGMAQWIENFQTNVLQSNLWGFPASDIFLDSDIDGDRLSDQLAVRKFAQLEWWNNAPATGGSLSHWGQPGDHPLSTDFDGDGKTDKTIYRETDGSWWTILSSGGVAQESWGLFGDVPVPADFDGDGKSDYAVWRPWSGYWAVTKSSGNFSKEPENVLWKQWGLPGDLVMSGDYTGDSKADLVVWRPSNGTWYICSSNTNFDCSRGTGVQFGLPGDQPVHFDMDADGRLDYAVFRPSNATWYVRSSATNQILVRTFGSLGDYPVCSSQSVVKNFIR